MSLGSRFRQSLNLPPAALTRRRFLPVRVRAMRVLFDRGAAGGVMSGVAEAGETCPISWVR
jgi:hypothetical protein